MTAGKIPGPLSGGGSPEREGSLPPVTRPIHPLSNPSGVGVPGAEEESARYAAEVSLSGAIDLPQRRALTAHRSRPTFPQPNAGAPDSAGDGILMGAVAETSLTELGDTSAKRKGGVNTSNTPADASSHHMAAVGDDPAEPQTNEARSDGAAASAEHPEKRSKDQSVLHEPPVGADERATLAEVRQELAALDSENQQQLLERAIIERGDRQLPNEPNRGFVIERLDGRLRPSVPVEEAFLLSENDQAKEFAQGYIDGTLPIEIMDDVWTGVGLGRPGFVVYFPVAASEYQNAVAAGEVPADLFGTEGKVSHTKSGAEALDALVDPEKKRERVEAYYHQQTNAVDRIYVDDLEGITNRADLPDLTEAYELTEGSKNIRLLNLSSIPLSEEQLRQTVNAVRASSDKGGGDNLRTIVILPEDHPMMSFKARDEEGEFDLPHSGEARGSALYLSDRPLQRPEDRKPRSDRVEKYWREYFDKYRLPGEPTEGPGSPKETAANFDWETLLAHELEHNALRPNDVKLPGPGPTLYSRVNEREHEAELGAIEHMGGKDALAVPEDQRQAKREMWQQQRGSNDGGLTYNEQLGPRFVVCRELDLTQGPLPRRFKYPGRPLPTEVTYRLVPEPKIP